MDSAPVRGGASSDGCDPGVAVSAVSVSSVWTSSGGVVSVLSLDVFSVEPVVSVDPVLPVGSVLSEDLLLGVDPVVCVVDDVDDEVVDPAADAGVDSSALLGRLPRRLPVLVWALTCPRLVALRGFVAEPPDPPLDPAESPGSPSSRVTVDVDDVDDVEDAVEEVADEPVDEVPVSEPPTEADWLPPVSLVEPSESAAAIPCPVAIAVPTPSATARPPTRPMYCAAPIQDLRRTALRVRAIR
nr:hypothetical protein [Mycolicibacterium hassiacum]